MQCLHGKVRANALSLYSLVFRFVSLQLQQQLSPPKQQLPPAHAAPPGGLSQTSLYSTSAQRIGASMGLVRRMSGRELSVHMLMCAWTELLLCALDLGSCVCMDRACVGMDCAYVRRRAFELAAAPRALFGVQLNPAPVE